PCHLIRQTSPGASKQGVSRPPCASEVRKPAKDPGTRRPVRIGAEEGRFRRLKLLLRWGPRRRARITCPGRRLRPESGARRPRGADRDSWRKSPPGALIPPVGRAAPANVGRRGPRREPPRAGTVRRPARPPAARNARPG